jgi:hypothetical protein
MARERFSILQTVVDARKKKVLMYHQSCIDIPAFFAAQKWVCKIYRLKFKF